MSTSVPASPERARRAVFTLPSNILDNAASVEEAKVRARSAGKGWHMLCVDLESQAGGWYDGTNTEFDKLGNFINTLSQESDAWVGEFLGSGNININGFQMIDGGGIYRKDPAVFFSYYDQPTRALGSAMARQVPSLGKRLWDCYNCAFIVTYCPPLAYQTVDEASADEGWSNGNHLLGWLMATDLSKKISPEKPVVWFTWEQMESLPPRPEPRYEILVGGCRVNMSARPVFPPNFIEAQAIWSMAKADGLYLWGAPDGTYRRCDTYVYASKKWVDSFWSSCPIPYVATGEYNIVSGGMSDYYFRGVKKLEPISDLITGGTGSYVSLDYSVLNEAGAVRKSGRLDVPVDQSAPPRAAKAKTPIVYMIKKGKNVGFIMGNYYARPAEITTVTVSVSGQTYQYTLIGNWTTVKRETLP